MVNGWSNVPKNWRKYLGLWSMVARDRFKYRFKLSELRLDSLSFLENSHKMSLKKDFESVLGND